jgi:UDP-N-acetylglucosamine acyltransferase
MSETRIHPSAIVSPKAKLDQGVEIGPYAIIEDDVEIGADSLVGPHAVIHDGARLGREVHVHQAASVSCLPQDLKFQGEQTYLEVGDRSVIREYVTLSRGTDEAWTTRVGSDCLVMAYVHVAHDCQIGDRCILANGVQVAGHVKIGNWVTVGGLVAIHQFVRIGDHAFIGGGMEVTKDVPPYIVANDSPLKFCGLNMVGLKRRGFDSERLENIRRHYRLFFGRGSGNVSQALDKVRRIAEEDEDARMIRDFVEASERGLIGG